MWHNPEPEELARALQQVDEQMNWLYNTELSKYVRSGQACRDAREQDRKDIHVLDAWMRKGMR